MYEISDNTGNFCIECNKELGYLDPQKRKYYSGSIEVQSVFSSKEHPKFGKTRKRCFDCAVYKFGSITYRPNIHHSDFAGYLFDVEIDKSNVGVTLDIMINRYGEEEGKKKFDEYRSKQAHSNSFEYKKEKYGWTEDKFHEYNKSRAVTLENMIKKYGEEEGKKKFDEYRSKQAYTNTIDHFIEKYGYEEGVAIYIRVCDQKSVTLKNMIRIYGSEKGALLYEQYITNKKTDLYYSEISQKLFRKLDDELKIDHSYFGSKNNEFGLRSKYNYYFYDYVVPERKKIIEFNGDYWHANPKMYDKSWAHPVTKKAAFEIWESDSKKFDIARDNGYDIFVVWESDFRKNEEETIKQCVEFLNNES